MIKYSLVTDVACSMLKLKSLFFWFGCVEILWPSQPNSLMLNAVSLPNYMFTGQA